LNDMGLRGRLRLADVVRGIDLAVGPAVRASDPGEILAQRVSGGGHAQRADRFKPLALSNLAQKLSELLSAVRT
jgi:hypothetical protein